MGSMVHTVNVYCKCKQAVCIYKDMLNFCSVSYVPFHLDILWYTSSQRQCVQFSSSAQVVALFLKYTLPQISVYKTLVVKYMHI